VVGLRLEDRVGTVFGLRPKLSPVADLEQASAEPLGVERALQVRGHPRQDAAASAGEAARDPRGVLGPRGPDGLDPLDHAAQDEVVGRLGTEGTREVLARRDLALGDALASLTRSERDHVGRQDMRHRRHDPHGTGQFAGRAQRRVEAPVVVDDHDEVVGAVPVRARTEKLRAVQEDRADSAAAGLDDLARETRGRLRRGIAGGLRLAHVTPAPPRIVARLSTISSRT